MILVSRVLKGAPTRWANTVAAVVTTAFIVGGGSWELHVRARRSSETAAARHTLGERDGARIGGTL